MRYLFALLLLCGTAFGQPTPKAIPDFPRFSTPISSGGYLPISINNATRSIDVYWINRGSIDSLKSTLSGKIDAQRFIDSLAAHRASIALKFNISDTSSMLTNYRHWVAGYLTNTTGDARYYTKSSADARYLQSETDPHRLLYITISGTNTKTAVATLSDSTKIPFSWTDLQATGGGGTFTFTGTSSQYVAGDGSYVTFPTIPTNNNQLTNGSGFITPSALSPYITSATAASTYATQSSLATTNGNVTTNTNAIGTLSGLTTTAKNNLVAAINEVNAKSTGGSTDTASLSNRINLKLDSAHARTHYIIDYYANGLVVNSIFFDSTISAGGVPDSIRFLASVPTTGSIYFNTVTHKLGIKNPAATYWLYFTPSDSTAISTGGGGGGGSIVNTEASTYFTNASVTDAMFKSAYDAFVTSAKSHSYYSKLIAFYPLPTSTQTPNEYDAITASHKGAYGGTITTASDGITYTNGYFNTGIAPNDAALTSNIGFFTYQKTAIKTGSAFGSAGGGTACYMYIATYSSLAADLNGAEVALTTADGTGLLGFFRTNSTTVYSYKGTTFQASSSTSAVGTPNSTSLYMGAYNNAGSAGLQDNSKTGGFGIFKDFTTTNWTDFAADYQTFLTAIGR